MTTKLKKWDVTEHLQTEADIADYLAACEEEGDPVLMEYALQDVARASAARGYEADAPLSKDDKNP